MTTQQVKAILEINGLKVLGTSECDDMTDASLTLENNCTVNILSPSIYGGAYFEYSLTQSIDSQNFSCFAAEKSLTSVIEQIKAL